MILLIYAHPYPSHSRAGSHLLAAAKELPALQSRSLYDLYPDFDIDVAAEQSALQEADLVVWLHPLYWYSVPGLLKHWLDVVLVRGWAFGPGGDALHGKHCLWAATTGGASDSYAPDGMHQRPFTDFIAPIEQTARFCGMHWAAPFILHGAPAMTETDLLGNAHQFRGQLEAAHQVALQGKEKVR